MIPMRLRASCPRALPAALLVAAIATRASAQVPQSPNLPTPAGADVIVIIPDSLQTAPRTLSELLRQRVPSASVSRSTGALGASALVSLRDASVVRGDDPLVVIDGIRQVTYRASLDGLDRRAPSILDDIMLDDVARVEILNGPAAAASYGYDGQRGVIVVTTRQPGSGPARFQGSVTTSAVDADADYPRNLARVTAAGTACPFAFEASGYCTATSTSRYTPLLDRSPFRSAAQARAHLGATGGVGALGYAASLGMERGAGAMAADATDRTVAALRLAMPLASVARLGLAAFATERGVTTPREGSSSVLAGGIGGGPIDCSPATPCGSDSSSGGYRIAPLARLEASGPHHRIGHLGQALTLDADATSKISLRTSASADLFRDEATLFDSSAGRIRSFTRTHPVERSWRVGGSQSAQLTTNVGAALSTTRLAVLLDVERSRGETSTRFVSYLDSATAARFNLPPGQATVSSSWRSAELRRRRIETSLDQRLAWGDRASLGFGVTRSATSWQKFSPRLSAVIERHADAAYQLVQPASPLGILGSLRVRTAYGESSGHDGRDVDEAITLSPQVPLGPPTFRPDRSAELEGGFDASFSVASSRISITAFRRRETIQDLVSLASTNDPGAGITRQVTGGEAVAEATPIDIYAARLHLRGQLAVDHDRVIGLALDRLPLANSYPEPGLMVARGQSWAAWEVHDYSGSDANGDGRIELSELHPSGFRGPHGRSRPSSVASLTSDLEIARSFTLTALVDHVGGFDVYDMTSVRQCLGGVCPALNDPGASLSDQTQALLAAARLSSSGYLVPGDATRLRELSLSWHPLRAATMLHASSVRVTLAAYDLASWTRTRGIHPETDVPLPGYKGDLLWNVVQPIPRTVALRVALGY